jgi:hypothetical protein
MVRATVTRFFAMLAMLTGLQSASANGPVEAIRPADRIHAYELLPDNTQAVVWIRNADELAARWNRTELARLAEDPVIRPFFNDQREAIEKRFTEAGWRLTVRPEDIAQFSEGQIALGWLELPETRKPYALAMIVDVADDAPTNQHMLSILDQEMTKRGAAKAQLQHEGVSIVRYTSPKRTGQLLSDTAFYAVTAGQLLVTDDEPLIKRMISRVAGKPVGRTLTEDAAFIQGRQELNISEHGQIEYFVRPLGIARVLRAIGGKRSKSSADLLVVLQNQGFAAIKCVCGEVMLGEELVDMEHRGYVLADRPLPKSAGILDFPNKAEDGWRNIPSFVGDNISSYLVTYWNSQEAFWRAEGLVDELAGTQGVFEELIKGIKMDPSGPRIDIREEVLPRLTNDVFAITDNKPGPVELDSRRNLIALRITDTPAIKRLLDRALTNDPDARAVEVEGVGVWVVDNRRDQDIDPLAGEFGEFGAPPARGAGKDEHWLNNWAIAAHDGYLMFASHVEMIENAIRQSKQSRNSPLASEVDYLRVVNAIDREFGEKPGSLWQIARNSLAYRVQYELFREGKLRDSQSMIANLLDNLLKDDPEIKQKVPKIDGTNLPPFETIAPFLQPGGLMVRSTDSGWEFGGLLLSNVEVLPPPQVKAQPAIGTARVVNVDGDTNR